MKIWIGITDGDWFDFLRARNPDEVNFWQPSGAHRFRVLEPGEPFLFKLHSPQNYIVGGGFFVRYSALPCSLAWAAFGEKNGVADINEFLARIRRYRHTAQLESDPTVGCNILTEPFFLPKERWIAMPPDWSRHVQRGKSYSTTESAGAALWNEVRARLPADVSATGAQDRSDGPRYGDEYLARARLWQGAFRVLVTEAYGKRCAITGERVLPVLEAAHIRPFASEGPNRVANGLLLRSDLHTLFDRGYLTVTPDFRVLVSKRIKEEFENGREYYAYAEKALAVLPPRATERPATEYLRWHSEHRFEHAGIAL